MHRMVVLHSELHAVLEYQTLLEAFFAFFAVLIMFSDYVSKGHTIWI